MAHHLYVSPSGRDSWTGQRPDPDPEGRDGPLATVQGARDAIRRLKFAGGFEQPVEVLIRGGHYELTEPVRLAGGDSGTPECPISYRAYPGETPTLSGGRRITGWRPDRDGVYKAPLPPETSPWFFRQLFCNGQRLTRCRYPKLDVNDPLYGGWAFVESLVDTSGELDDVGIARLPGPWRFRTDPQRIGEAQGWFAPQTDESGWSAITVNASWQQQGHAFRGHAWYRTTLTLPEGFDTREHLWLVFGAVDKGAHVYLDGKKVLEHTMASTGLIAADIWSKPFRIDVRPLLVPGRTHHLAVKVESEFGSGGIWKPVTLVSTDREVNLAVASGDVAAPVAFRYAPGTFPRRWSKPGQAEVFVVPGKCWLNDIIPIRQVDAANHVIYLTRPAGPTRYTLSAVSHLVPGNRFYVENNREDLTEPGEWCFDGDTRTVYLRPPAGVDINDAHVAAPCTERLVEMIGSTGEHGQPLSHVSIEGLRFTQTQVGWPTPQAYYKTPNAGSTLYMENTRHCTVRGNEFDAVGGDAIRLQNHNADNRIIGNHIHHAGAYGVFVASYQKGYCRHDPCSGDVPNPHEWHAYPEDRQAVVDAWPRSTGHVISDNHIHHVGVYEKHAQGVAFYGVSAPGVTVAGNHIHHIPRFGIGLMSGFGQVIIEHNHLHDLSLETCDTGGITANRWYAHDSDPTLRDGPIVRHNRVFDVVGCGAYGLKAEPGGVDRAGGRIWTHYYSWGIYFDNAPMNVQVYGNVTAGNTLGGIMISWYARNVAIHDNVFLNSSKSQVYMLFGGDMRGLRMERNIFSYRDPEAVFIRLSCSETVDLAKVFDRFDGNVIHAPGGEPKFSGVPAEALQRMSGARAAAGMDPSRSWWEALGFDTHSVRGDPRFVAPEQGDYRLQPDSPALALGFAAGAALAGPASREERSKT